MIGARPLTEQEQDLVLDQGFDGKYRLRNQTLFALGFTTGFRIGELLSIKLKDVLNPDGNLKQNLYIDKRFMKGRLKSRSAPITGIGRQYLTIFIMSHPTQPDDYLFGSRKGGVISVVQAWRVLDKAFNKVAIFETRGTHCMRKTFAKEMYEATGERAEQLQRLLGHKNIDSTVSYISFNDQDLQDKVRSRFARQRKEI